MSGGENGSRPEDAPTTVEVPRSVGENLPAAFSEEAAANAFDEATESLPAIDAPPQAQRRLEGRQSLSPGQDGAPRLGAYVLVARFPSSETADVYLGYKQSNFGFVRRAVVKWVASSRPNFAAERDGLLDEAKALSFLDHPNIVSVLDMADDERGTLLALEYVSGTDLRRIIRHLHRRGHRMPAAPAVFVACEVLRALAHAHAAHDPAGQPLNLIHRDVNPSNVLVADDGFVKLSDFGTVLMAGRVQGDTARGLVKGKVRYLAPEYILDDVVQQRVDLYSTGVMLFEMLTGQPCFASESPAKSMIRIVKEGLPYGDLRDAGVADGLIEIIERCTDRDPQVRPASARGMIDLLEAWMSAEGRFASATALSAYLYSASLYE